MPAPKEEVMTFKLDHALAEELRRIPNRSSFIRNALLLALNNACPLCGGDGVLTSSQRKHWDELLKDHYMTQCPTCREPHLVCDANDKESP